MGRGRPCKYDTDVKPRFLEIQEWLELGATDKEIAKNLGINKSVLCKYKNNYPEFKELIKNGRKKPVQAIKAALYKRAIGFSYTETKQTVSTDGESTCTKTETATKYSVPDPTAAMMLLKHWDTETEWTADPASLKLKKRELELKEQKLESEEW